MVRFALVLLVAAPLSLGACGEDDDGDEPLPRVDSTPAETPPPTEASTAPEARDSSPHTGDKSPDRSTKPDTGDAGQAEGDLGPTRTEYIARADPICAGAQARVGRLAGRITTLLQRFTQRKIKAREYYPRSARLTDETVDVVRSTLARLRRLPPPQPAPVILNRYLAATDKQADLLAAQAAGLRRRDDDRVNRLQLPLLRTAAEARKNAHAFGFAVCGRAR